MSAVASEMFTHFPRESFVTVARTIMQAFDTDASCAFKVRQNKSLCHPQQPLLSPSPLPRRHLEELGRADEQCLRQIIVDIAWQVNCLYFLISPVMIKSKGTKVQVSLPFLATKGGRNILYSTNLYCISTLRWHVNWETAHAGKDKTRSGSVH